MFISAHVRIDPVLCKYKNRRVKMLRDEMSITMVGEGGAVVKDHFPIDPPLHGRRIGGGHANSNRIR